MNIPAHWLKETRVIGGSRFRLRGVSDVSMQEARERLESRAATLAAFHAAADKSETAVAAMRRELRALRAEESPDGYSVDITEPIIDRLDADNIVTRNHYGAEVLNSTSLCMLDVDAFPDGLPWWRKIAAIFMVLVGRDALDLVYAPETHLRETLHSLCVEQGDLGVRLYRTAGGWRILMDGRGLAPDSERMAELSRLLHVDPLYLSLCLKQKCWRARLTPKPYRLRLKGLGAYPRRQRSDMPAEGEERWLEMYNSRCGRYGVCRLVECIGCRLESEVVAFHDERTRALEWELPLR